MAILKHKNEIHNNTEGDAINNIASASSKKIDTNVSNKNKFILPVVLMIFGYLLNIGGRIANDIYGLPFYLDSAGTILVGALGGMLPGIAVALATNLTLYFFNPNSVYFGILNIFIAIFTVVFFRKTNMRKLKNIMIYIAVISLVAGGLGGTLYWRMIGFELNRFNTVPVQFLQKLGLSDFIAWYLVNFIFDFVDKLLCATFVSLCLFVLPRTIWSKFELVLWLQKPITEDDERNFFKSNHYAWPLKNKIVVVLGTVSIAIAIVCSTVCIVLFKQYTEDRHIELAESLVNIAVSSINPDDIEMYLSEGRDFESYDNTANMLFNLLQSTPEAEYIYAVKILPDGCHVVFDVDYERVLYENFGSVDPFDKGFFEYIPDLLSGGEIPPIITDTSYGKYLTVYKPVTNQAGECVCYVGLDMSMKHLVVYDRVFFIKLISIFSGFLFLILAVGLWLARFHLIMPINAIAYTAYNFDYKDEYARKLNYKKLSMLDIQTSDEIEGLYHAFLRATEESTRFFESNKHKVEQIENMQTSLVMVLADMVENRDQATGQHVRKTAEYVRVTAEKMRELGFYTQSLTDDFIRNIVRSAPLHDIGKIAIPDAILNKPGKLSPEEFEIMKTHAIEGRRVIERAIDTLQDADYLEEAKYIAGYHHERWDGTGYPEGLKGEEIPLSARIMAIADVFDALVSKRVYKEAFSYEKAMSIIEEEGGTHFDPLVVDAFLKARDDVFKIAGDFEKE